jgi:hypothetical protein
MTLRTKWTRIKPFWTHFHETEFFFIKVFSLILWIWFVSFKACFQKLLHKSILTHRELETLLFFCFTTKMLSSVKKFLLFKKDYNLVPLKILGHKVFGLHTLLVTVDGWLNNYCSNVLV